MPEGGERPDRDVVLGLNAAWGFAPADQSSPALAGAARALIDVAMTGQPVTELRIHGVSGSNGPTMLEHPEALQVAGDNVTGFYRRWSPDGAGRPSVAWKLEAYSWGGLTESPLASASWLLMAPLMMYNLAYFMLPPSVVPGTVVPAVAARPAPHLPAAPPRQFAAALLRLLALAATVQFVTAVTAVTVSTVAWQAAGRAGMLPGWMGWYGALTAGWRVAFALAAVALTVAALWWVSVTTASKYEARISRGAPPELNERWPMTQPGFWKGRALVTRQRALHSAAALAAAALVAAIPAARPPAARWVAVVFAAVVLAAAAISAVSPLADRQAVTLARDGRPAGSGALTWCRILLAAAGAALLTTALMSGLTDHRRGPQPGALPGFTTFCAVLLAAQVATLLVLAGTVVYAAARARRADRYGEVQPYLRGGLSTLVAVLGLGLGGLLTAVINFGVTRLLGTPVPSGFQFGITPPDALTVPWPIYAFAAAPIGMLAGGIVAAFLLGRKYLAHSRGFRAGRPSPVADAYRTVTAGPRWPDADGDDESYAGHRGVIAKAWAVGLLAEQAASSMAWVAGGGVAVALATEAAAAVFAGPASNPGHLSGLWQGLSSLVALVGVLVAGWLVTLLRQAYSDPARRKTIGALWDVATFWPRAVHPLAPPCYAERAVPEVVDRIRLLTGQAGHHPDDVAGLRARAGLPGLDRTSGLTVPPGPVLLTGYSQGSVIAPAVLAQLAPEVRDQVALLTLACPARRLYGRAFPAFFGGHQLATLAELLDAGLSPDEPGEAGQSDGRWKNLYRKSDYIGSWIFAEPQSRLCDDDLARNVDQPCWDPVILVPDGDPTPPPVHRHSAWWPDPRTRELGAYLVGLLAGESTHYEDYAGHDEGKPEPGAHGSVHVAFARRAMLPGKQQSGWLEPGRQDGEHQEPDDQDPCDQDDDS